MPKRYLFCKSKQFLTNVLIRHLKKTSQRHARSVSKTLIRQRLSRPFFRYFMHSKSSGNIFHGVYQSIYVKCRIFRVVFTLVLPFFRVFYLNFCHFFGSRFLLMYNIDCLHHNFPVLDN